MRHTHLRLRAFLVPLAIVGLGLPRVAVGQEAHAPAAEHAEQEHDAGSATEHGHEENEIAVFVGATERLKFEDDETGLTFGLEYQRGIGERAALAFTFEWAGGDIERDWIGLVGVYYEPFDGWAERIVFTLGAGIEVAKIDEIALEIDEHGGSGSAESHGGDLLAEGEAGNGERETEVEPLARLGVGYAVHIGSFSLIPQLNFDIVSDDVTLVGGVALGFRF